MQFDYSKYLEANIIAIIIITINICIIIAVLKNYIGLFIKRNLSHKDTLRCVCLIVLFGILTSINISKLIHGGMYVFFENEADRVQVQGKIESIEEIGYWGIQKHQYDGGSGTQLTVNGICCRTIHDISMDVGDYVSVGYLPKSGYILDLYVLPNE